MKNDGLKYCMSCNKFKCASTVKLFNKRWRCDTCRSRIAQQAAKAVGQSTGGTTCA